MRSIPQTIDLTSPCPHCGACCVGSIVLSYALGDRWRGIEVDRPLLAVFFEADFSCDSPAIVQEWNACTGWTEAPEGAATDALELLALIERHAAIDADGRLARLAEFVREAHAAGAELVIRYD